MLSTKFLRPNMIRKFSNTYIRTTCNINCKDNCMVKEQMNYLKNIDHNINILTWFMILNSITPPAIILMSTLYRSM